MVDLLADSVRQGCFFDDERGSAGRRPSRRR
jgi:hypothetical protein